MVEQQIKDRGIHNANVECPYDVPRHKFVPDEYKNFSYDDRPLPIGHNQTISQPYIVAYMTEILNPDPTKKYWKLAQDPGIRLQFFRCYIKRFIPLKS